MPNQTIYPIYAVTLRKGKYPKCAGSVMSFLKNEYKKIIWFNNYLVFKYD